MSVNDRPKISCFVIISFSKEFIPLRKTIEGVIKELGVQLSSPESMVGMPIAESIYQEIAKSDLVIAVISQPNPNIFYEIGLAHAAGKPVIFLFNEQNMIDIPSDLRGYARIAYNITSDGLTKLRDLLIRLLDEFIKSPRRFRPFLSIPARLAQSSFIIDLEKLDPRKFENLCFELITQMGFQKVEWGKEVREIDAIATLPKKDPDGYEYQELWFILMGRRAPIEMMSEMAVIDPEHFLRRIVKYSEVSEKSFFYKYKTRYDTPITILFILQRESPLIESLKNELKRMEGRVIERSSYPFSVRIRWWDTSYLTALIQQYPQIAFKYFSEEARIKSKYRKTSEELYEENVNLTEELITVKNRLEEEKKKRFIAERDAAWKDVAFKAAHKLGNPIDAIDTYLLGLKRRIESNRNDEALQKANDMEASIEEAKAVIAQFKSLTKVDEIAPRPIELLPLIQQACKAAEENGINVNIQTIENIPQVMADPDRISECFNELVANSLHWFDKPEKKISVNVYKLSKKDLPEILDKTQGYLKIRFEDNGCGVLLENKEKIFAPFYTTHPHGTGIGLSLVKRIVEGHGGQIYENGKPGEGASFEVYLPIAKKKRSS